MVDRVPRQTLDSEAEVLAVCQLDLLAQIEAQLRAVHHLMRRIDRLRSPKTGQPTEPMSNGQRSETLRELSGELEAIEQQVDVQLECCEEMRAIIGKMIQRLPALKQAATLLDDTG
jgi:uncharacterized coiled-coil DUF342 family protein